MSKPTTLESAVLLAMAQQLDSIARESLLHQSGNAFVSSRKNTGSGFFTYFETGKVTSPLPNLIDLTVGAEVEGIEHGVGFVLWVKDGHINCLEGFSYQESTTDLDWETVKFKLIAS